MDEFLSNTIKLRFEITCPNCGELLATGTSIHPDELPDGRYAEQCEACSRLIAISWVAKVECEVYLCDKTKGKKLGEIYFDAVEDSDSEVEA